MSARRYSFDSDPGEHAPLGNQNHSPSRRQHDLRDQPSTSHHHRRRPSSDHKRQESYRHQGQAHQQSPRHQDYDYDPSHRTEPAYRDYPPDASSNPSKRDYARPSSSRHGSRPNSYHDQQSGRQRRRRSSTRERAAAAGLAGTGAAYAAAESSELAPVPPPHRSGPVSHNSSSSITTPGADAFSESAGGGMPGLAASVANQNPRESGMAAMRGGYEGQQGPPQYPQDRTPPQYPASPYTQQPHGQQQYQQYPQQQRQQGYYEQTAGYGGPQGGYGTPQSSSSPSLTPMGAAAFPSGRNTPSRSNNSLYSHTSDPFTDAHLSYGQRLDPNLGQVNPHDIDDDGDDGINYARPARNSLLSLGNNSSRGNVAAGAAAGGVMGGVLGRNRNSAHYDPVSNPNMPYGAGAGGNRSIDPAEKSAWLSKKEKSKKRRRWCIIIAVSIVILAAITGGVLGGLLSQNGILGGGGGKSGGHSGQSATDDQAENGDLDINSSEIKALMNNPNLHKVFPGVDYTPLNVQYPDCLHNPPSQNNITRDVAVISQLTNTLRLYGTDCNQTEMTIHAIRQLKLENTMKIWMGVWQDGNTTTNERQLSQMWHILDQYGSDHFKGVIVANEILFRKQMTLTQLGNLLQTVRTNLTSHGWTLPVATSDLGDDWTSGLGQASDYIMSNIHPFFGGMPASEAAGWTWSFWENQNKAFWKADKEKNIIAEIGWPTKGGQQCPNSQTSCSNPSVASIDGLNQLLEDWVCPALTNGTNYFWFELFDEPWKISFNTPGKEWEDQWGLMDVNRNLKSGVKIPDCGGRTV